MNADGSGQTNLTNNPATDAVPAWSPDGVKIAFDSERDGNNEIYVMNSDGTGQTRLTHSARSDTFPAWSNGTVPAPTPSPSPMPTPGTVLLTDDFDQEPGYDPAMWRVTTFRDAGATWDPSGVLTLGSSNKGT